MVIKIIDKSVKIFSSNNNWLSHKQWYDKKKDDDTSINVAVPKTIWCDWKYKNNCKVDKATSINQNLTHSQRKNVLI